jgi:hypothetical protein
MRDMNDKNKDHPRDFTVKQMKEITDKYNSLVHTTTGKAPQELEGDKTAQKKYIIKQIYQRHMRKKIPDQLHAGDMVRFMPPRDKNEKRRWQVSPEVVEVKKKVGDKYLVMAADGSTKEFPQWRLFPTKEGEEPREVYKGFAVNNGIVLKIIRGPNEKKQFFVEWDAPKGMEHARSWEKQSNIEIQVGGKEMIEQFLANKRAGKAETPPVTKELPAPRRNPPRHK